LWWGVDCFAFESRLKRGATRAQLAWHTVKRAVILFLLGIVVNSFPFFELVHMRFYGVLQRIAVCYLVVGLFYLWDRRVWTKVAALVVALVGYWVLLRWVPVPGAGMPGRDIPVHGSDTKPGELAGPAADAGASLSGLERAACA
jgi:predicted acyltransferase